MKSVSKAFLFIFTLLGLSCNDTVKDTVTYMANVPVYMSKEEFNATTKVAATRPLKNPGKICLYGDYLFINELNEGIHVIDNTDPSSPQNVAFIEIMGNIDLAAKDGILYADNLVDLLLFDIADPEAPTLKSRVERAFDGVFPATNNDYPVVNKIDFAEKVVVNWTQEMITEDIEYYYPRYDYVSIADKANSWYSSNAVLPGGQITGVNGSMSRFAITDSYLYAIYIGNYPYFPQPPHSSYYYASTTGVLKVFNIENDQINQVNSVNVSTEVETLFAYKDHLFIGMSNGMNIYSIENPTMPSYISATWHFWGCDPVVINDNYAYLTVRSTNVCGQSGNLLQVIDISDIAQPKVVSQYTMTEPYGLGIDDNKLFVCDNGLKVFDATVPSLVGNRQLFSTTDFMGFDLIPYNGLLLVIGSDGLYQYKYTGTQLNRLSMIPVSK